MTESPRARAERYLRSCAAQIAPYWSEHYESKVPPEEVLDFFDQSVANLVNAEPGLAGYFGIYADQTERLTSDLLDMLIHESHIAVRNFQEETAREKREWQVKSSAEKIAVLEAEKAGRLAAAPRADVSDLDVRIQAEREAGEKAGKEQSKADRLAYLRAKRDAKFAAEQQDAAQATVAAMQPPSDPFVAKVQAALNRSPNLVDERGAITALATNEIISTLALKVAEQWAEHGGQSVDSTLRDALLRAVKALLHGINHADGTWDTQLDDGTVHRSKSAAGEIGTYWKVLLNMIEDFARPSFSYEQHKPWNGDEIDTLVLTVIDERVACIARVKEAETVLAAASKSLATWQELHPAPPAAPYGVSPAGAERWCRDWLEHMGLQGAEVTQQSGDGGVDVVSPTHIVQVKHYTGSVSIAEIRELVGVAAVEGRLPIFMTSGLYPVQAEEFADKARMLLYRYDVETGQVEGCTGMSRVMIQSGFLPET